jgi:hypothetical protein
MLVSERFFLRLWRRFFLLVSFEGWSDLDVRSVGDVWSFGLRGAFRRGRLLVAGLV